VLLVLSGLIQIFYYNTTNTDLQDFAIDPLGTKTGTKKLQEKRSF